MAERLRKMHQDDVRSKIQTSQLINRLTDHALGRNNVTLEATQVRSIEVLLKKVLPDLQAIEHSGEVVSRYDLSGITSDRLVEIESILESAQSASDGEGGTCVPISDQIH